MARPSKTDQELMAFRDCWTELRTLEAEYHAVVSMYCTPLARPGCFRLRLVYVPLMDNGQTGSGTQAIEWTFPGPEVGSYAAVFWRKAMQLSRQVMEAEEMRAYTKTGRG